MLKIGVPVFGYQTFPQFAARVAENGWFSANLGDNIQSIAIRSLLERMGIAREKTISLNRDTLPAYRGEAVALIMNGVFKAGSFPLPDTITPIFIGLCVDSKTVATHRDWFARHAPIGCRDIATCELFRQCSIEAFVSGCLSLTMPLRRGEPAAADGRVLLAYGQGAGEFPSEVLPSMPTDLLGSIEMMSHRIPLFQAPLDLQTCLQVERYARSILADWSARATLVVTPLHHVAAPSIAMGIPTVLCRRQDDSRFSYLKKLMPVWLPGQFHQIDWRPKPVDLKEARTFLVGSLRARLIALGHATKSVSDVI